MQPCASLHCDCNHALDTLCTYQSCIRHCTYTGSPLKHIFYRRMVDFFAICAKKHQQQCKIHDGGSFSVTHPGFQQRSNTKRREKKRRSRRGEGRRRRRSSKAAANRWHNAKENGKISWSSWQQRKTVGFKASSGQKKSVISSTRVQQIGSSMAVTLVWHTHSSSLR